MIIKANHDTMKLPQKKTSWWDVCGMSQIKAPPRPDSPLVVHDCGIALDSQVPLRKMLRGDVCERFTDLCIHGF